MVKVLIVDDSAFIRNVLTNMLSSDPDIKVVGIAKNGIEAIEKTAELKPDLVTMDVEMPKMNGIEALKHIMTINPVPVLMVSAVTTEGAKETLEALEIGAVDFIPKNLSDLSFNIVKIKELLIEKIKKIAERGLVLNKINYSPKPLQTPEAKKSTICREIRVVAIGTSTGGPKALYNIISKIPKDFPVPILIAQHMPPAFTGPFAERLNQLSSMDVKEAENGEIIKRGTAYVAPGAGHMGVTGNRVTETSINISADDGKYIYKPSVDLLMLSISANFSGRVLGVILTGLGNDGEKGIRDIKNKGGKVIAESKETCVVYGMPKAIIEAGLADKIVPLDNIAAEIVNSL
ncbi:MAG: chemotaxis response regulator protein-glutamate methylesterase [Thermodesulfovibrionia bacterium]|nr:chemotaxis response regulator protein-glutamate methylesterase [Thermodesulfovibrionia bacterium]